MLVQLATLQTSFVILDEAIKVTSRRVNALDTVVIPRLSTQWYIKSELDELEREEFFRLKRSQDKKKKDIELKALEKKAEAAAARSSHQGLAQGGGQGRRLLSHACQRRPRSRRRQRRSPGQDLPDAICRILVATFIGGKIKQIVRDSALVRGRCVPRVVRPGC